VRAVDRGQYSGRSEIVTVGWRKGSSGNDERDCGRRPVGGRDDEDRSASVYFNCWDAVPIETTDPRPIRSLY
jgi:hypothetical protein